MTPIHRIPATAKVIGLVIFAVVVVAVPREWVGLHVAMLIPVAAGLVVARSSMRRIAARLVLDAPFAAFAVLLPLVASGPRVEIAGVGLSVAGLWGGWAMLAKATLCILAACVVSETTEPRRIVMALEALRLPVALTAIMGFMLRYLDVIADEARSMRIARDARGFRGRGPRSWQIIALAIGAMFIRAHARGERVHLARLARGLESASR